MQNNLATKLLPIISDEKKLEVSLIDDQTVIKLSTWTENLGWCCQKTLTIDDDMLDDLHRLIAAARYKLKSRQCDMSEANTSTNVLSFPGI